MKEPVLPLEGDLLFEEKSQYAISFAWIPVLIFALVLIMNIYDVFMSGVSTLGTFELIYFIFNSIMGVIAWYMIISMINDVIKNGFNDETYKGYYFKDKIIFYRISKYVDEIYTQKLSKEQIEVKIKETKVDIESMEKLLADSGKEYSFDTMLKIIILQKLEKGLNLIENGLGKPHKIEVLFSEIKYFINEENVVKLVEKNDDDENNLIKFYNNLTLSKKYKKYQSDIVEFLNQRILESAVFEDGDNVN
jgi:hypothetical protein